MTNYELIQQDKDSCAWLLADAEMVLSEMGYIVFNPACLPVG